MPRLREPCPIVAGGVILSRGMPRLREPCPFDAGGVILSRGMPRLREPCPFDAAGGAGTNLLRHDAANTEFDIVGMRAEHEKRRVIRHKPRPIVRWRPLPRM